jgi:chitin disaccharide deacetylase
LDTRCYISLVKFSFLVIVSLIASVASTTGQAPRLIVRGDDMGYAHDGNTALIQCSLNGVQTSIEVIVPSPWFPEAVKLLQANPQIDVGVHLALTSEWDNVKWRPLTSATSLREPRGFFYPMVFPNPNYPGLSLKENKWLLEDIEQEFRAQIETAQQHLPQVSHWSAHMGCVSLSDDVRRLVKRLAIEYKINIDLTELNVTSVGYDGPHKTLQEKTESFIKMLSRLEKGKTYVFVDHPGLDGSELRSIGHIGYENVAEDRQGVTSLFTSEKVKARIRELDIELISYKALVK